MLNLSSYVLETTSGLDSDYNSFLNSFACTTAYYRTQAVNNQLPRPEFELGLALRLLATMQQGDDDLTRIGKRILTITQAIYDLIRLQLLCRK